MKNMAATTFMAFGLMAAAALAQQQPGRWQQSVPSSSTRPSNGALPGDFQRAVKRTDTVTFDEADKNNDGKLTRREARAVPNLRFSSADADKDAALNREEFVIALGSAQPRG